MHCRKSGVADYYAEDDVHALTMTREIVANLPEAVRHINESVDVRQPKYDVTELAGIVPANTMESYDVREVIARLVDGSELE